MSENVKYFESRDEAELFCAEERKAGRDRSVFSIEQPNNPTVFVVAHTINRANDFAVYLLRKRIGLKVSPVKKGQMTLSEQIYALSAQQVQDLKKLLEQRQKELKNQQ